MKRYFVSFLIKVIKQRTLLFFSTISMVMVAKILVICMPIIIGKIIDLLGATPINQAAIWQMVYIFMGLWVTSLLITPIQEFCITKFVQDSILAASLEWMQKIMHKDFKFFNSFNVGNLVNSIDRGILSHEKLLYHVNGDLLPMLMEFVIATGYLIYSANIFLVGGLLFLLLVNYTVTNLLIIKRRPQIARVNDAEDDLAGEMTELLSNGTIFKLEQSIDFALNRVKKPFIAYAKESVGLAVSAAVIEAAKFMMANLATTITLIFGFYAVVDRTISVGELVTMLSIVTRISSSFNNFLQSKKLFDQFGVDVSALLDMLQQQDFKRSGNNLLKVDSLELDGYKSQEGEAPLKLKETIKIQRGQKVAIVGPTGKGKSTLLNVLAGLSAGGREVVKINGVKLSDISSVDHLSAIRYCPQNSYLVSGSLNESVFFSSQFTERYCEIFSKLELKQEFCNNQKILNERATNISGGEAKRLSLARIFNTPGEIMIFDEPTSALNKEVANTVWDNLFTLAKDKIMICTTHDLDRLSEFDQVIYL